MFGKSSMGRKIAGGCAALALTAFLAVGSVGAAAADEPAHERLAKIAEEAFASIRLADASRRNETARSVVESRIVPMVDRDSLGRMALGKNWRALSDAHKARFSELLLRVLAKTYARVLSESADSRLDLRPARWDADGSTGSVTGKVHRPSNALSIRFDLRRDDSGETKVTDLLIEGISIVGAMRSSFQSIMENKGVEGLLEELSAKAG